MFKKYFINKNRLLNVVNAQIMANHDSMRIAIKTGEDSEDYMRYLKGRIDALELLKLNIKELS